MKPSQIVTCLIGASDLVRKIIPEAAARGAKITRNDLKTPGTCRHLRGASFGGFSQKEVAFILGLSERAVRMIEKRALRKLFQHPELRALWQQYLTGDVEESAVTLSRAEVEALLGLARNRSEHETILTLLKIVGLPGPT